MSFAWQIDGAETIEQKTFVCKALHNGGLGKPPRLLKLPLLCAILPEAITQRRLVPAMAKYDLHQIRCRGLARARPHDEPYDTVFLNMRGKKVEHVKLACISGKNWLVHPGQVLTPTQITKVEIDDEVNKKTKRHPVVVERIEQIPPCELRSKLFAIACFQAECMRAREECRPVDTNVSDALFDKDTSKWKRSPKQVFVLWTSTTSDGTEEHHATEVNFSTLFKGRL